MPKQQGVKKIADNRKAFHDYFVLERFEAGIELAGTIWFATTYMRRTFNFLSTISSKSWIVFDMIFFVEEVFSPRFLEP